MRADTVVRSVEPIRTTGNLYERSALCAQSPMSAAEIAVEALTPPWSAAAARKCRDLALAPQHLDHLGGVELFGVDHPERELLKYYE